MRPTWADIDLSAIKHNVMELKKNIVPSRFCAVVKADAYGHGAVQSQERQLKVALIGWLLL